VFWICWEDVLAHFNNFHLSWNPSLFRYVFRTHGLWREDEGPKDDTFSVGENPQYVLALSERAIQRKATVWILVSRHVTKQEQEGCEATDFLTVHVHRSAAKQRRVWYAGRQGGCILTGAYTNNPHVLVRYDLQGPQDAHLTLVLSQYQKSRDLGYTLSCFCTDPFSLGESPRDLEHTVRVGSAWTSHTSGGPLGTPSCEKNPAFALHVPESAAQRGKRTKVQLRLTAVSNQATAVNVAAFPVERMGDGMRKATGGPVLDSGAYRHGFCVTEASRLPAGSYVIVATTYTPGMLGSLELVVASSSAKIQVEEIS
jgi:calpain-7